MANNVFNLAAKVSLFIVAVVGSGGALAATCANFGGGNWSPSGAPIRYQQDAPVGTLSTKYGTPDGYSFRCVGDTGRDARVVLRLSTSAPPIPGYTDVYPTNIEHVGVRFYFALSGGPADFCPINFDDTIIDSARIYNCRIASGRTPHITLGASAEFVKLLSGSGDKGLINQIPSVTATYAIDGQGSQPLPVVWSGLSNVVYSPLSCSVSLKDVQIILDDVLPNHFNGVGSVAKPRTFNIELICDPGARKNITINGTQNTDSSEDGVLELSNAGSREVATGVGIQILYENRGVALNKRLFLNTSTGAQEILPFTVQYYQTKSQITPGIADAIATLDITYQ